MQIVSQRGFNESSSKLTKRESKVGKGRVMLTVHIYLHLHCIFTELITSQILLREGELMLTVRLTRSIKDWVELRVISFQRLFIYFIHTLCSLGTIVLTIFWEWSSCSLTSSNCFTILDPSMQAMVLHWTRSLSKSTPIYQCICKGHHLDVCCTERNGSSTCANTQKHVVHTICCCSLSFHIHF